MKYELTGETRRQYGRTLHRIRALHDITKHGVMKGDLGGWIESEDNLSQDGHAWVGGTAKIYGEALIYGDARIYGDAMIYGDAVIGGDARIGGLALIRGNARIYGNARVGGVAVIGGDARIGGDAMIDSQAGFLTATIYTTQALHATAFRQRDGSWHVRVGCWVGLIAELRALTESDKWVETLPEDTEEARPELLAFVALCEARAARSVA